MYPQDELVSTGRSPRPPYDLVAIAASVGGLAASITILTRIPAEFPAPLVLALHIGNARNSILPSILARRTKLQVSWAEHGELLMPGRVYIAPAGVHLRIGDGGTCLLASDAPINFTRPAADPLFVAAAKVFGPRTIGVVLSGRLNDGAVGCQAIARAGGLVIVQAPSTCVAAGMPQAAIGNGSAKFSLSPSTIAHALVSLLMVPGAPALFGVGGMGRAA